MKNSLSVVLVAASLSLSACAATSANERQIDRAEIGRVGDNADDQIVLPGQPLVIDPWTGRSSREVRRLDETLNTLIVFDSSVLEAPHVPGTLLEGRTVLVKDNIETTEWATTAGSLALTENVTGRDAPLVVNLRENGGLVLGKANLSEWANFRSTNSSSGWSAVGGQTRNPHAIDRSPCGSSNLRRAGAELVDIEYSPDEELGQAEYTVLLYEFQRDIGRYLKSSPADIPVRSLKDLIDFNAVHALSEMRWFGQEIFEMALETTDEDAYSRALATSRKLAREEGIDHLLAEHEVAFLIAPTRGPAWNIDLVLGDTFTSGIGIGTLAAVAGYPHLTVPMGHVEGLPVGLSFIGAQWDDRAILHAGAAYERARSVALPVPGFAPWEPWGATATD